MLKGYVSTEEVQRLLGEWLDLYGVPTTAELSIRFMMSVADKKMKTTYTANIGPDPYPDAVAVSHSLGGVDTCIRPLILKEKEYHRQQIEELLRNAKKLGFQLIPIEVPAAASRVLKLNIAEPDDSVNYDSN